MAINWNNVAAPDLGESNSLFAQAIQSLKDAGTGLKDTAKDYQTVVRNKSHAILQDYINSAKTPEELQSEAFNTGFKNLQATLANEYDAVKVNDYRDNAVDKLTKRAGDAVALKRNTLGLATDQQAVDTNDMMNRIFTAPESERPALIAEAVKLNRFDAKAMLTNQVGNSQLTQLTDANNLFKVQKPFLEVQPKLANEAVVNGMSVANRNAATAEKNANTQAMEALARKAEAEARANGGGFTLAQVEEATVRGIANVRKIGADVLAGVKDKFKFRDMKEVDDAILADETWSWAGLPKTAKLSKEMINNTPEFSSLPNPVKAAMYMGLVTKIREDNVLGKDDWFQLNRDKYFAGLLSSARENTGYIENAKEQEKVAIQDFAITVNRMSGKAPDDAFGFKFAKQQLGVSALDGYGASPDILDKLNKSTIKQPAAPVTIRQNRAPEVQALNEKYLKTKDLGEKLKLMHQMTQMQQQYEAGTK